LTTTPIERLGARAQHLDVVGSGVVEFANLQSGPIAVCLNELAEYCLGEYGPAKEALEHFFPAGGLQQDVRDAAFSLYALVFDCIEV
jgi:hypothetical protein